MASLVDKKKAGQHKKIPESLGFGVIQEEGALGREKEAWDRPAQRVSRRAKALDGEEGVREGREVHEGGGRPEPRGSGQVLGEELQGAE